MLDIFVSFLTDFTQKIFDPSLFKYRKNNKCMGTLIKMVITYGELLDSLYIFQNEWQSWIDEKKYNKKESVCLVDYGRNIKKILINLNQCYSDIYKFLNYVNHELKRQINDLTFFKSTIFDVWEVILSEETQLFFDYENQKQYLYIPNYSLILSETKTIGDLSFEERENIGRRINNFHIESAYSTCGNWELRSFVPALQADRYTTRWDDSYILRLELPKDISYIKNYLKLLGKNIKQIKKIMEQCRDVVEKYSCEENKDLLRLILHSYD